MADIAIQTVTCSFGTTDTTADATITSVDMDHAFLVVPQGNSFCGHDNFTTVLDSLCHIRLLNATTIRATRAVGGGTPANAMDVHVTVIEDTTGGTFFTVLGRGVVEITSNINTHTASHTTATDLNQVCVFVHGGAENTRLDYASWRGYRDTTSQSKFVRGNGANVTAQFSYEVVEWASGFTVKEHTLTDNGGASAEDTHTIGTLTDLTDAVMFRGGVESDVAGRRGPDDMFIAHAANTVTDYRTLTDNSDWSAGVKITLYSVHHTDLAVQRFSSLTGGSRSTFSGTSSSDTITSVDTTATTLHPSQEGNSGTTTTYARDNIWLTLDSATQVTINRAATTDGTIEVAYQVADWSGFVVNQTRGSYGAAAAAGYAHADYAGDTEHGVKVEMAMSHTSKTAIPANADFTDITSTVLERSKIKISRGFDRARRKAQPGRCEFVVDNRSRDFEPGYNGTYGIDGFKPGRPVKVSVTYRPPNKNTARSYRRFYGFVRSGKPHYVGNRDLPTVRVQCVDIFAILARAPAPTDTVTEVGVGTPFGYWQLTETSGTTATDDGSGANNGTYGGTYTLADAAWSDVDPDRKHVDLAGGDPDGVTVDVTGITSTGAMSVIARWLTKGVDSANLTWDHTIAELGPTGANNSMSFTASYRPDGVMHYRHGTVKQALSDPNVDPDLSTLSTWRFGAWTRNADASEVRGYIDGELTSVGPQDCSWEAIPSSTDLGIGLGQHSAAGASSMGHEGNLGDVAIYEEELSPGRIAAIYQAAVTGRPSEDAGARIDAILNDIGVPAGWRDIEAGESTLQAVTLDETSSALELIERAARSEHGVLYVDRQGKVRFENRWHRTYRSSVGTFGDYFTDDPPELAMVALDVDWHEERIINVAKVTRAGGAEQVAAVQSSEDEHGRFEESLTTDNATDAEALCLAQIISNEHSEPDVRLTALTVNPRRDPTVLYPIVLDSDVSTRLVVKWRPDGVQPGTPLEQDSYVDSLTETIGEKDWSTTYALSPAATEGFWVLGESQLGVDTRLGA